MKKILFQGDSITDANRSRDYRPAMGYGYPTMVAGLLGKEYPGELEFVNLGISGNRVVDLYARVGEDMIEEQPDFLTILIGINDVWHEFGEKRNGIENPKFYQVYSMLIEELRQKSPKTDVILLEPFVLKGPATESKWRLFRDETALRAASVKQLAAAYGLTFVPLQSVFDAAAEKTPAVYWLSDGVHPTAMGHGLIAEAVADVLRKKLG